MMVLNDNDIGQELDESNYLIVANERMKPDEANVSEEDPLMR